MKTQKTLLMLAILITSPSFGQNIFPTTGNVGIGTSTPNSRLDLGSGYGVNGAKLLIYNDNTASELSGTKCGFYMDNFTSNNLNLVFPEAVAHPGLFTISAKNTAGTTLNPYFSITGLTGNVGIGTKTPQSKLQVSGSITLPLPGTSEISEEGISFAPNHRFNYDGKFINHYGFGFYPYSKSSYVGGVNTYMSGYYGLDFFTQDINRIRIDQGGNVGIGTTTPDQKLTVNGIIHAKEIIVDTNIFPDYVFQKYYTGKSTLKSDYIMPTLAEIESFTKKNHHLPNVPSAQEVQQNGVSLGEMSNVLLQKVEELTLYAIEQNKKLMLQQEELERLKKEKENYKSLAERLSAIEKVLKK